jgi:hypothetical protein
MAGPEGRVGFSLLVCRSRKTIWICGPAQKAPRILELVLEGPVGVLVTTPVSLGYQEPLVPPQTGRKMPSWHLAECELKPWLS